MQTLKQKSRVWFTDFDGTIKPEGEPIIEADLAALRKLKAAGWHRVVATGRSLFGFVKEWTPALELDALIFSSGAGLCLWAPHGPGALLTARTLPSKVADAAIKAALDLGFGFFAYLAPPDNHHFYYHSPKHPPLGFTKRLEIYSVQHRPWPGNVSKTKALLSQLLIMVPQDLADEISQEFTQRVPEVSIVQASSPFGDAHRWLEIFPQGVSKGQAAAKLAQDLGLSAQDAVASGNDYNDQDLLAWAGQSFVTDDAPEPLRQKYENMPPAGSGGLAWATAKVLSL